MADQQNSSRNESPSWMTGALITAVTTSLVLFIALIQRYLQRLSPRLPDPEPPRLPLTPLPPTLSDHAYNPDYDYHIESPPWGRYAKILVSVAVLILFIATAIRFQSLIAQLVIAAIVAYILNPIINFVDRRTKVTRGTVLIITYLLMAALVIWGFISLGLAAFGQAGELINQLPAIVENITVEVEELTTRTEPIKIGNTVIFQPNANFWATVQDQLVRLTQTLVSRGTQLITQIVTGTAGVIGNMLFIFVLSIYIAIEIPKLSGYVSDFAQTPGYRKDAERLMQEFGRIWSAYLRGQVILGLIVGFIVWIGLLMLGVENSGALGVLSGLLEFVPIIGPVIGAGAAMIVAFFQSGHCNGVLQFFSEAGSCGIVGWQFTLIVLGLMFVIQQLENNILVPRIVGEALDLHPLLVMLAVFMGGSLAGILGAILAAPVAATLKLLGIYIWRKMFDDYPFQTPELPPEILPPQTVPERIRTLLATLRPSRLL